LVGAIMALFILHQGIILPAIRTSSNKISELISKELDNNPNKGVLFFNASSKEFPRTVIYPDSPGPSMQGTESTELTQATYGSYWPAEMNVTKILNASFACDIMGILNDGRLRMACPYGTVIKNTDAQNAVIVANIGFEESDPLGKNVRIFKNFAEFEPYFFSRRILNDSDPSAIPKGDSFAINFDKSPLVVGSSEVLPDKSFDASLLPNSKSWLVNYGQNNTKDNLKIAKADKSNKTYLEYSFNFLESDIDTYINFNKQKNNKPFEVLVSWNGESWISLGKFDGKEEINNKNFTIQLSHLNVHSFAFKLIAASSKKSIPPLRSIHITKRAIPSPLK